MEEQNAVEQDLAIRRILLLHGIIYTIGGIPILYLGDELGMLNDYSYTESTEKDGDSRWLHRPAFDWARAEMRKDPGSVYGRIYEGLLRLAQIRQQNLAFTRAETEIMDAGNDQVFGYFRQHDDQSILVLANFSERQQIVAAKRLRLLGLRKTLTDVLAGKTVVATQQLVMEPYQLMVLMGIR
jgi:amylosucrase/maltose alpha-D-glucosyltransferase/alpha-amylase